MSDLPRVINIDTLIAQADAEIEEARNQEQLHTAEAARWAGDRRRAEAWRARLLTLLMPAPYHAQAEE